MTTSPEPPPPYRATADSDRRNKSGAQRVCSAHPSDMVGCLTCGQVGPDDEPRLEVVAVLRRGGAS